MSRLSAFSGSDQEVVPGVLRGYRVWVPVWTQQGAQELRLRAVNFSAKWVQGRNVAICGGGIYHEAAGPPAPQAACTCGFYARHDPYLGIGIGPMVVGVIKAYGKVILGTEGFRAQYAEIEALSVHYLASLAEAEQSVEALEDYYQVPVYWRRADLLRDYPPISVQHLLPEPEPPSPPEWVKFWTEGPGSTAMMMTPAGPMEITAIHVKEAIKRAIEETRRTFGAEETS